VNQHYCNYILSKFLNMFIVIEKHGGWEYASIVIDENGNNKVFDTIEEAQKEADDCQDGIVVGNGMWVTEP
jgi:hypothetical protein